MQITYTAHASTRMAERGIRSVEVEATLRQPLRQIPASNGRTESQGLIERGGQQQLLRVIHQGTQVVLVITVMETSKISKYQGAAP